MATNKKNTKRKSKKSNSSVFTTSLIIIIILLIAAIVILLLNNRAPADKPDDTSGTEAAATETQKEPETETKATSGTESTEPESSEEESTDEESSEEESTTEAPEPAFSAAPYAGYWYVSSQMDGENTEFEVTVSAAGDNAAKVQFYRYRMYETGTLTLAVKDGKAKFSYPEISGTVTFNKNSITVNYTDNTGESGTLVFDTRKGSSIVG